VSVKIGDLVRVTVEEIDGETMVVARDIEGNDVTDAFPDTPNGRLHRKLQEVADSVKQKMTYRRTESTWREVNNAEYDVRHRRAMSRKAGEQKYIHSVSGGTVAPVDENPETDDESEEIPDEDTPEASEVFPEPIDDEHEISPAEHHSNVVKATLNAGEIKPATLFTDKTTWKLMVRNAVRPVNTLLTGEKGSGKSVIMRGLAEVLGMNYVEIPLNTVVGHAREMLIGQMQADPTRGTFFNQARFLKAIQTPFTFIGLDELSRADGDTQNILLQATNPGQGYVSVDEMENAPVIQVARGVVFFATANIGMQYTATRLVDAALLDRFMQIDIPWLGVEDEKTLLKQRTPNLHDKLIDAVARVAAQTRAEAKSENGQLNGLAMSTREAIRMVELMADGFTLDESAQVALYPAFPADGGSASPRSFVKQAVQAFIDDDEIADLFRRDETVDPNGGGVPWAATP
jgi:MoxR-like ATPase